MWRQNCPKRLDRARHANQDRVLGDDSTTNGMQGMTSLATYILSRDYGLFMGIGSYRQLPG